jgi:GNAT superfamily N-acetyltransferase
MEIMITQLLLADFQDILNIVNDAATVYKGVIPSDCWKEPYMPAFELEEEIRSGVHFYGYFDNDVCVAVMGIQAVKDVTLIRHAYVLKSHQRKGLGKKLLMYLLKLANTEKVYVGTWRAASWAIEFYQKNRFQLVTDAEKDKLLKQYWNISPRQIETSVVLQKKKELN